MLFGAALAHHANMRDRTGNKNLAGDPRRLDGVNSMAFIADNLLLVSMGITAPFPSSVRWRAAVRPTTHVLA